MIKADIIVTDDDYEFVHCSLAFPVLPLVGSTLKLTKSSEVHYIITSVEYTAQFFDKHDYNNPPEVGVQIYVRKIE